MGKGGDPGPGSAGGHGPRLGVDLDVLSRLPRLRRTPLSRVLRGVLRRRLPRAARLVVGDLRARALDHLPQLGPPLAPADLRRRPTRKGRELMEPSTLEGVVEVHSYLGPGDERTLADDVLDGLTRPLKELPPKHFYDARGSELFDAICELPEYYQTRTERLILEAAAEGVVARTGAVELVELGSGSATKTRLLLDAMAADGALRRYVPVGVSA